MTEQELIELLAAKEHASWSHWMTYQFTQCTQNADGSVTIPQDKVERWQRQAATEYAGLTEQEKQSDRNRVIKILPIINQYKGA